MRLSTILLIATTLLGCKSTKDNILENYPSAQSPDKKAVVYQTSFEENGIYKVSLGTWIESAFATGGSGIFDIQMDTIENLKFEWTSDSSIKVVYPSYGKVLRQERQCYFAGKDIYINYEIDSK
ncbi:MAG: hypothetical protein NVV82_24235 [Sporocytophaga sp.]|nr:hypothetical protein [Sporocytophaga sp.]